MGERTGIVMYISYTLQKTQLEAYPVNLAVAVFNFFSDVFALVAMVHAWVCYL